MGLHEQYGVNVTSGETNTEMHKEIMDQCRIVVIAVKPHFMPGVLKDLAQMITSDHLIVSVAAGCTIEFIQSYVGAESRVARVMPNTPALIGQGAGGFTL